MHRLFSSFISLFYFIFVLFCLPRRHLVCLLVFVCASSERKLDSKNFKKKKKKIQKNSGKLSKRQLLPTTTTTTTTT